jgi:SAM-dependent methyltransferase
MNKPKIDFHVPPKDNKDLADLYNYIYKADRPVHPKKGLLPPYGSHDERDKFFIEPLRAIFKGRDNVRVLDASCGRGHLLMQFKELGWDCEGTELSSWIIENSLKRIGVPIHNLSYDDLNQLPESSFDVVCSNDVLEHLVTEQQIDNAFRNFAFLSRDLVAMTIATGGNTVNYTTAMNIRIGKRPLDLHQTVRPGAWWISMIEKHLTVTTAKKLKKRIFVMAKVK